MSRLFADPIPVSLAWCEGELVALELLGARIPVVEVVRHWRVDGEWWDGQRAFARDCLTVRTADGMLCDLVLEDGTRRWSLQRVYD